MRPDPPPQSENLGLFICSHQWQQTQPQREDATYLFLFKSNERKKGDSSKALQRKESATCNSFRHFLPRMVMGILPKLSLCINSFKHHLLLGDGQPCFKGPWGLKSRGSSSQPTNLMKSCHLAKINQQTKSASCPLELSAVALTCRAALQAGEEPTHSSIPHLTIALNAHTLPIRDALGSF